MTGPAVIQSLVGGLALPIPVHSLLLLNGNVFGISGFIHRGVRGNIEAAMGATGLILGGVVVGLLENGGPTPVSSSIAQTLVAGFLVGLGTRLANGCTSGHMICGLSRFSLRSLAATATFFTTGVAMSQLHRHLPARGPLDWSLSTDAIRLIAIQAIPLSLSLALYAYGKYTSKAAPQIPNESDDKKTVDETPLLPSASPARTLRGLTFLNTAVQFGFALHLAGMTNPTTIVSFLILPFSSAWDPSLAFLAIGAMPLSVILYRYFRGEERPLLGGDWSIPTGGDIDLKLVAGSAIFGVGWGLAGVCPGPGLVNFGRALGAGGQGIGPAAAWLGMMVLGGLVAQ